MKKLIIVTNYNGSLPQILKETEGIDLDIFVRNFDSRISIEILTLDELNEKLIGNEIVLSNIFFFFCSSQDECYKNAIVDTAFEVKSRGGNLIPDFSFYLSHENKYYQELYKARVGISTPASRLVTSSNNMPSFNGPCVVKPYGGFASRGVTLVTNANDLSNSIKKNLSLYITSGNSFEDIIRKFVKKYFYYRGLYPKYLGRAVIQDFIPGLKYDWKLLVFGKTVFALKRYTRKNDFRASGSGKFDYDAEPSPELIRFAVEVREKLKTPFVSIDVAESIGSKFSVIEYQSVHFGLATAINAVHYFEVKDNEIKKIIVNQVEIEVFFAKAMLDHIEGKFDVK